MEDPAVAQVCLRGAAVEHGCRVARAGAAAGGGESAAQKGGLDRQGGELSLNFTHCLNSSRRGTTATAL